MNKTLSATGKALVVMAAMTTALSSCIKDEALNAEADITGVTLADGSQLLGEPVINNSDVILYVNTNDSVLAPEFTVTDGATISPASGTPRQFFTLRDSLVRDTLTGITDTIKIVTAIPQTYAVTSEDGRWTKTYTVNMVNAIKNVTRLTPTEFHFDDVRYYEVNGQPMFQILYESIGGQRIDWGSGNAGAMVTLAASHPAFADYPTSQADGGVNGKCAKLTTIATGALGTMFGAPIAAGNLFLGSFVVNMQNMPASTHFGIPLRNLRDMAPVSMSGYYKYRPGSTFLVRNAAHNGTVEVPGRTDDFAIYAVIYEVTADAPYVDGNTVFTSANIVSRAEVKEHTVGDDWVSFDVPFEPQNGKTIDEQKLRDGGYNIAIVLSSSEGGASFEGAVGSTLYVDEFRLNYQ